jgi:H+/Cl- antiporter ClcA
MVSAFKVTKCHALRGRAMSQILKLVILSLFVGIMSGALSSAFMHSLNFVTDLRLTHPLLIFGLPFYGFALGLLIKKIPHHINQGVPYIIQEIDNPDKKVSILTAPYIFLTALGTHLFGGSAGREGVGVLMGASIAHVLPTIHPIFKKIRGHLIYTGIAAGFSSIFGTPLAAMVFAFELHKFKEMKKLDLLFSTLFASLIADQVFHFLGPNHQKFEVTFNWDFHTTAASVVTGLVSGAGALLFFYGMKHFTHFISKLIPSIKWKLLTGGALVTSIIFLFDAYDFSGIGTHMIERSFTHPMALSDFFLKWLLTVITIAVGFKGGEVTPLFFMGATLSNSCLSFLNFKNFSLSSALGMTALFGAVTNTPYTSAIMACELFGWKIGLLSLTSCLLAKLLMGNKSFYRH